MIADYFLNFSIDTYKNLSFSPPLSRPLFGVEQQDFADF